MKTFEREIKFRGLDNQGIWHYGDLIHTRHFAYILNTSFLPSLSIPSNKFKEVNPETVGQFTGLKNKNGKEIYEGHIFHLGDINIKYIVEWFDCGLRGRQNGNMSFVGLVHWKSKIEIIGNIHQNPELL